MELAQRSSDLLGFQREDHGFESSFWTFSSKELLIAHCPAAMDNIASDVRTHSGGRQVH